MPAPTGTVWGNIVGNYGKIGICTSLIHTNTQTTASVDIWFWSKYSINDSYNDLYFDNLSTSGGGATTKVRSGSIKTSVSTGSGWNTQNQVLLESYSYTYTRGTSNVKRWLYAQLLGVDKVGGAMSVATAFVVPALPSYTITYNANGGSGAPSAQTKRFGEDLSLSETKPTRTGYTFRGWATSATASESSIIYSAGATFVSNENVVLYAMWEANKYTVSYNANGGTGAPASQTKTYGVALTLSSTKPTRTNYTFKGWATSAAATTAAYAAGGSYTANNKITLYAVWENAYVSPAIYNLTATRCDSAGTETDDGTCGLIKFGWKCTYDVSSITIAWSSTAGSGSATVTASGKNGSVSQVIGNSALSTDAAYTITVTVADSNGTNSATTTLSGNVFPLDCLAGGKGIAFGKPAELEDVADFAFDAKFNKPVYGKALGMDKVTEIPASSDLDNYREPGCYAVYSDANAKTIANIPVTQAGRLEVWSSTGEGVRLQQWSYLRQRYISYKRADAVWEREISRGQSNTWTYSDWWQSSLTPTAAEKVYHKQKILWGSDMAHGMYMTNTHTATLLEKVSDQATGIALVFCYYNGEGDTNWGWNVRFVPKTLVELMPGDLHVFQLSIDNFRAIGTKYLYIHDGSIVGHTNNDDYGTASAGFQYANNRFVLRYVIGV